MAIRAPGPRHHLPGADGGAEVGTLTPCKEDIMKKLIVLPAVLLLLACQDHNPVQPEPEIAPELVMAQARAGPANVAKMVPFKGKGTWQMNPALTGPTPEGRFVYVVALEGTATHLGRLQWDWTGLYDFLGVGDDGIPITVYLSHDGRFTAANGDELHDEGCVVEHGTVHEYYVPLGTGFSLTRVKLVGGTGRFENAEGWYDLWVTTTSYFPLPEGTWEFEGWISTVGSTRGGR